jgi:hypothetical protein
MAASTTSVEPTPAAAAELAGDLKASGQAATWAMGRTTRFAMILLNAMRGGRAGARTAATGLLDRIHVS